MADYLWDAIDLFWMCYSRVPGQKTWVLQRTGYPEAGPVLQQNAWLMWAFSMLERAFCFLQADLVKEARDGQQLAAMHQQVLQSVRAGQ